MNNVYTYMYMYLYKIYVLYSYILKPFKVDKIFRTRQNLRVIFFQQNAYIGVLMTGHKNFFYT